MTVQTNTTNRKALAQAIAEELGTTAAYLGVPSCAYQAGPYTIHRDGSITGEDFEAIRDFLNRNDYAMDVAGTDLETAAGAQPDENAGVEEPTEAQPEDNEESSKVEVPADLEAREPVTQMDVLIPARDVTVAQLKNLTYMLYSRQDIINRMTDSGCLCIPEILIQRLTEIEPDSPEAFTDLLDDFKAVAGLAGFDYRDGKVSMTFPFDESQPEKWTAYASLLQRIYDAAIKATRVYPERAGVNEQNEKYLAHTWLQRLGYHGADHKAERKILLGHLKGYCAFGDSEKMQAHRGRHAALRQKKKAAEQQPAEEVTCDD